MAGIFGLGEVRTEQINDTWPEDPNFGYFGGGLGPSYVCTIDRLDFSNETTSAPGNNLTQKRYGLTTVSTSEYGYFGGGFSPPNSCIIDRLDFSNETTSNPPANLTQARNVLAAVSNNSFGYFAGGIAVGPTTVNTIDRLDFSNETTSNPPANLTQERNSLAAVSNNSYGYFGGGLISLRVCTIDRLDFSNETTSTPGNHLTQARDSLAAVSNNSYGYFGGGFTQPPEVCTIDRLDFSNETVSAPGTYQLTEARYYLAAVSSGTTGKNIKHLRKTSSTDIDGNPISNSYGYFVGGGQVPISGSSYVNTIDRLDFSTETRSSPNNRLIEKKRGMVAVSSSNYGYIAGGWLHFTSPPAYLCTIERLDFSTETLEAPGTYQLTTKNVSSGAVSNSNYGYFGGGVDDTSPPYIVCTIDRLDFSTETIQYPVIGHLTEQRSSLAAVSTSEYGYFGAGSLGGVDLSCTIDRLDFSNETVDVPGTLDQLTISRHSLTSVYNSNYGYFAGGRNPGSVCTIERLDFSTETVSEPGSYQLTEARYDLAAVSNNSYGYFGGGYGPPWVCTIDRLDFSSETMQYPVTSEQLSEARTDLAGLSN